MPTLLIVDDHASFRIAARAALGESFTIVGEAADGASAVARTRELRPDVVLLDLALPDVDGFAVATALAALKRPPVVVLMSSRARCDVEPLLRESPAQGFVEKERLSADTLDRLVAQDPPARVKAAAAPTRPRTLRLGLAAA
jgi:DNA-binding NarL/FixJ family response regulator